MLINDVNVIPMHREVVLEKQRVWIANGKILKIEPASAPLEFKASRVIDGSGRYLIPGLSEMHYHWRNKEGGIERDFKLLLANGVTTARNMGEYDWQDHIGIRDSVQKGFLMGPAYYTTGPYLQARDFPDMEAVDRVVSEHRKKGYDFLKLADNLPKERYLHLLEEAHRQGVTVIGHGQRKLPLEYSLRMKSIEHVEEFVYILHQEQGNSPTSLITDEALLQETAREVAHSGVYVAPTLVIFDMINRYLDDAQVQAMKNDSLARYMLAKDRAYWLSDENLYIANFRGKTVAGTGVPFEKLFTDFDAWIKKFTTLLASHHVPFLAGSDTYGMVIPGFSLHQEMQMLRDVGLSPYEALKSATVNPARYLGTYALEGTVAEGKVANLVLLRENPLTDIAHTQTIEGVFLRGQWLDREQLDTMLAEVARLGAE